MTGKLRSALLPLCVSCSSSPSLSVRRQTVRQTARETYWGKVGHDEPSEVLTALWNEQLLWLEYQSLLLPSEKPPLKTPSTNLLLDCMKRQRLGYALSNPSLWVLLMTHLIVLCRRAIEFLNILVKNSPTNNIFFGLPHSLADIWNLFLLSFDKFLVWSAEKVRPEILLFICYCICLLPPHQQFIFIWWTLKVNLKA